MDDEEADIPPFKEVQKVLPNRTKESYMGYSVTTGYFAGGSTEYVATGAPRYQLVGAVVIYRPVDSDNKFNNHVRLMAPPSRKLGSYYGGSVLALDVNNDGMDDLFVGAPLYVDENYDEGRVFVYVSKTGTNSLTEWVKESYAPIELKGDSLIGGRFGTAMADAGDLNQDGYKDVVIGAPLADGDRGAVFVYHGSATGVDPVFKQKILATQLTGVTLKYFGQSLQGGVDLDDNNYPDIAVGAPKSDTVVIFRSRPVVSFATTIRFRETSTIDIFECIDKAYFNCTTLEVCIEATGKSVEDTIGVKFNVTLDSRMDEVDRRLEFRESDTVGGIAKSTWSLELNLTKAERTCRFRPVHMKSNIKNYDSTVEANVVYDLLPSHTAVPLSSVRDPSKVNKISTFLNFTKSCTGTCDPDLAVDVTLNLPDYRAKNDPSRDLSVNKTVFVLDKITAGNPIPVRVNLSNLGENAFDTKIRIKYSRMISLRNIAVIKAVPPSNSCVAEDTSPNPSNGLRTQMLRYNYKTNIMRPNTYCYFEFNLIMDPLKNSGTLKSFTVEVAAELSDDTNTANNKWNRSPDVLYTSDVTLKKFSKEDVSFNATTKTRNVTSVTQLGNGTDDIVSHFTIRGNGYSNIPTVTTTLDYPLRTGDDQLLYLYKVECNPTNLGRRTTCSCDETNVNTYNLTLEAPNANNTNGSQLLVTPKTKLLKQLRYDCKNKTSSFACETLTCTINNIGEGDEVTFKAFFRLWTDNILFNKSNANLRLELRSQFQVSSSKSNLVSDVNGNPILKTDETVVNAKLYTAPVPPEPTANNLWIYILGAVGGLLLLILLVFILWKVGFFKSKYADMKKDAQDEIGDDADFAEQNGS